jgi:hypothetical protein
MAETVQPSLFPSSLLIVQLPAVERSESMGHVVVITGMVDLLIICVREKREKEMGSPSGLPLHFEFSPLDEDEND